MACFIMEFPFEYSEISIEIFKIKNENYIAKHAIFLVFSLSVNI